MVLEPTYKLAFKEVSAFTNNLEFIVKSPFTKMLPPKEASEPTNKREFKLASLILTTLPVNDGESNGA